MSLSVEQKQAILRYCKVDRINWPTILLFISSYFIWGFSICFYLHGSVKIIPLFIISTICQYCLYTCLHESVHNSISEWHWINHVIGIFSATALFAPFWGFRYVHLKHHRFTNNWEKDPDIWSARNFLLLRWFTQDFYYYLVSVRDYVMVDLIHRFEILIHIAVNFSLLFIFFKIGYLKLALLIWLLSARLVIAILSFTFNYLPHHPHDPVLQNNIYKETVARTSPWLTLLLLYQNYHNIHHLYPAAPFYRYKKIWDIGKKYFISQGTVVKEKVFQL